MPLPEANDPQTSNDVPLRSHYIDKLNEQTGHLISEETKVRPFFEGNQVQTSNWQLPLQCTSCKNHLGKPSRPYLAEKQKQSYSKLKTIIIYSLVMAQGTSKAWSDSDPPALCRLQWQKWQKWQVILGASKPGSPNFVDLGGGGPVRGMHMMQTSPLSPPPQLPQCSTRTWSPQNHRSFRKAHSQLRFLHQMLIGANSSIALSLK